MFSALFSVEGKLVKSCSLMSYPHTDRMILYGWTDIGRGEAEGGGAVRPDYGQM